MRAIIRRFEERWAVYFVPQPDELLARLGRIWFAAHGHTPYLASPRQYGFHATLKAPFDMTAAGLLLSARRLALRLDPVVLPSLRAVAMGRYLALTPEQPCPAVAALAQSLVVGLDFFRVPAQRHWVGLTPRQRQNARRWGYPWTGRDYHFHMTLAGPFASVPMAAWLENAQQHFAPLAQQRVVIDTISLCRQPTAGVPFSEVVRLPLGG